MKIVKFLFILIWISLLLVLLAISITSNFDSTSLIYWWFTFGWIFVVLIFRLKDTFSLKASLGMFVLGGLLALIGFLGVGEILMRSAFVMLLVGCIQALIEYKKFQRNDK